MEREGCQERVDKEMDPGGMKPAAGAGSTEERCPICLEDFQDKAFVNACFHILITNTPKLCTVPLNYISISALKNPVAIDLDR